MIDDPGAREKKGGEQETQRDPGKSHKLETGYRKRCAHGSRRTVLAGIGDAADSASKCRLPTGPPQGECVESICRVVVVLSPNRNSEMLAWRLDACLGNFPSRCSMDRLEADRQNAPKLWDGKRLRRSATGEKGVWFCRFRVRTESPDYESDGHCGGSDRCSPRSSRRIFKDESRGMV